MAKRPFTVMQQIRKLLLQSEDEASTLRIQLALSRAETLTLQAQMVAMLKSYAMLSSQAERIAKAANMDTNDSTEKTYLTLANEMHANYVRNLQKYRKDFGCGPAHYRPSPAMDGVQ